MAKLPPCWDLFCTTVEGRQSGFSCELKDGVPAFMAKSIPKGSKPNFDLLVRYLRGNTPMNDYVRNWLADLFDRDATSTFQIKKLVRRSGAGAPANDAFANADAAQYVLDSVDAGQSHKNAVADARKKFGISRSALLKAVARLKSMQAEDMRVRTEQGL